MKKWLCLACRQLVPEVLRESHLTREHPVIAFSVKNNGERVEVVFVEPAN